MKKIMQYFFAIFLTKSRSRFYFSSSANDDRPIFDPSVEDASNEKQNEMQPAASLTFNKHFDKELFLQALFVILNVYGTYHMKIIKTELCLEVIV